MIGGIKLFNTINREIGVILSTFDTISGDIGSEYDLSISTFDIISGDIGSEHDLSISFKSIEHQCCVSFMQNVA